MPPYAAHMRDVPPQYMGACFTCVRWCFLWKAASVRVGCLERSVRSGCQGIHCSCALLPESGPSERHETTPACTRLQWDFRLCKQTLCFHDGNKACAHSKQQATEDGQSQQNTQWALFSRDLKTVQCQCINEVRSFSDPQQWSRPT